MAGPRPSPVELLTLEFSGTGEAVLKRPGLAHQGQRCLRQTLLLSSEHCVVTQRTASKRSHCGKDNGSRTMTGVITGCGSFLNTTDLSPGYSYQTHGKSSAWTFRSQPFLSLVSMPVCPTPSPAHHASVISVLPRCLESVAEHLCDEESPGSPRYPGIDCRATTFWCRHLQQTYHHEVQGRSPA